MTRLGMSTVVFLKTFKTCVEEAWKETDRQYHIPKSRFQGGRNPEPGNEVSPSGLDERGGKYHFRRFRSCFASAWDAADKHYHIPKSRHGRATEKQV